MTSTPHTCPRCLVLDLGAGSGRAILAELQADGLALTELHRFDDFETRGAEGLEWDMTRMFAGVETGLARAAAAGGVASIGVDSWGVDYGLVDAEGGLLPPVRSYRHPRSQRGFDRCRIPKSRIGEIAGAQVIAINTIFQLCDQAATEPQLLDRAATALMIAPLVSHHLSGVAANETTLARTSGLHDLAGDGWSPELAAGIGLPPGLLAPLAPTGSLLGPLRPDLAAASGLGPIPVVAVASHDTASAVLALAPGPDEAFLISGSWNLLGYETAEAALPAGALEAGYGSEGGAFGRRMVIRSLSGLHLMRRLRAAWGTRTGERIDFADLSARAAAAPAEIPGIDVSDAAFFDPPDLIAAMEGHAPALASLGGDRLGALAASIYRGLAADIARNVAAMERFRGRPFAALRLGGGGARDATLCAGLARALGRPVRAGPVEASAAGNAIVQFLALGTLGSLAEGQARVAAAGEIQRFDP